MKKKWIIIALVVLMPVGLYMLAAPRARAFLKERNRPHYQEVEVTRGDIVSVINSTGNVQPTLRVQVGTFVSGPITELLVDFINTAKWMLMNPRGDKHPTTMAEANEDGIAVTDRIEGYENFLRRINERVPEADEISLETRVLKTFSRLSGRELQTKGDLVRLSRELLSQQAPTPNHETV